MPVAYAVRIVWFTADPQGQFAQAGGVTTAPAHEALLEEMTQQGWVVASTTPITTSGTTTGTMFIFRRSASASSPV